MIRITNAVIDGDEMDGADLFVASCDGFEITLNADDVDSAKVWALRLCSQFSGKAIAIKRLAEGD